MTGPIHDGRNSLLRLLADDLTGALDSACPFATRDRPVTVLPSLSALGQSALQDLRHVAVSTETRHSDPETAARICREAVLKLKAALPHPGLWFKKVDSVLRGNPIAETIVVMKAGGFAACVFAPAFPGQGRVTVGGRQLVRDADTPDGFRQVGPDLVDAFARHGAKAAVWGADGGLVGGGGQDWPADCPVLIVDARTNEDLTAAVSRIDCSGRSPLWVGAGGLADCLGVMEPRLPVPPISHVIVGTNHPVTVAQVAALLESEPADHVFLSGAPVPPHKPAAERSCMVLTPSTHLTSSADVDAALDRSFPSLMSMERAPNGLFVTGGETLSRVLTACGATAIDCIGLIQPGIPVARLTGGRWDGIPVVTKSGGFGDGDLLLDLVRRGRLSIGS